MYTLIKGIIIIFAVIIASSLLSGAGILYDNTLFSAPAGVSKFIISMSFFYFTGSISMKLFNLLIRANKQA